MTGNSSFTRPAPFRRYFARILDIILFSSVLLPESFALLYISPKLIFAIPVIVAGGVLVIEAFALSTFGTTPGKALFALRVETLQGQKLTFRQAFFRAIHVIVSGFGLFIPVLSQIALIVSFVKVQRRGQTNWDEDKYRVSSGPMTPMRWIVIACLIVLMLVAGAMVDKDSAVQQAITGERV